MNTLDEFANKITRKHVLFDTCVVIRAFEDFLYFEQLLKFLEENNCTPISFSFIEFEFVRGAYDVSHREKRKEFLKHLTKASIPLDEKQTMSDAIKIANAYASRKLYSPSIVDCSIAAFLKKFHTELYFITLNHKDFPIYLFDREALFPIDTNKDVFSLAFYRYNPTKASILGIS